MKIACLQNFPILGEVPRNIERADDLLSNFLVDDLDLLVLPELAFTGYAFPTLESITPFLEPTSAGPTTQWAIRTAKRLKCAVQIGYPEVATTPPHPQSAPRAASVQDEVLPMGSPVVPNADPSFPHNYNATVLVDASGTIVAHYRKSHLYYTDATWAREGSGFYAGQPFNSIDKAVSARTRQRPRAHAALAGSTVAMGICMDLNAYNFTAPWAALEFGTHVVRHDADLVLLSMAWLSSDLVPEDVTGTGRMEPDYNTLGYWVERLRPVVMGERKTTVVCANRVGVEGETCYAGTSAVMRLGGGGVKVWDVLGKGEEGVLVVDTEASPKYSMRLPDGAESYEEPLGG